MLKYIQFCYCNIGFKNCSREYVKKTEFFFDSVVSLLNLYYIRTILRQNVEPIYPIQHSFPW